jgi:hypothetical protein
MNREAEESNPEAGTQALVRYDEMCRAIADGGQIQSLRIN